MNAEAIKALSETIGLPQALQSTLISTLEENLHLGIIPDFLLQTNPNG